MYYNIHKYSDPGLMFICLAPNNWMDVGSTTSDPTWSNQPVHIGCRRGLTMWRLLRMMMGDVSPNISAVHLRMVDLLWKLGTLKLFFAVLNGLFRASCCHLIIAEKAPAVLYKFKCLQCITSPLLQQLFSGNTFGESICNPRNLNPIVAKVLLEIVSRKTGEVLRWMMSFCFLKWSVCGLSTFKTGMEIGSGCSPKSQDREQSVSLGNK